MSESLLRRQNHSPKALLAFSFAFVICLIITILAAYALAVRTRDQVERSHTLVYSPPTTPIKQQVQRVLLRRIGPNGVEYLEILSEGTVNLYDANMKLIKSGLQGFGRLTNLFINLEQKLAGGASSFSCPKEYTLTLFTNIGTYTCKPDGSSDWGLPTQDLIDELEDIVDDTFAPTPTLRPTSTPPAIPPSKTPTPQILNLTPQPTGPDWNPLTPTPLPGYMTAPPFSCSDYEVGRPFTISNVICGVD